MTEALKREGFGVLTDIDCERNDEGEARRGFRVRYRILGACNPQLAYRALQLEDKIGTMLPCNVIVQQHADWRRRGFRGRSRRLYASDRESGPAELAKEVQAT